MSKLQRSLKGREFGNGNAKPLWVGGEPAPLEWFLAGLIPEQHVTILSGDGGLGKSFVAMLLSICICTGRAFLGRSVRRARVLWIDAENLGHDEVKRRAFQVARGLGMSTPPEGLFYYQATDSVLSRKVQKDVRRQIEEHGIDFVVLDSLSVGSVGQDMKEQKDTVEVLRAVERWGTVFALDHITKEGARGNQSEASIYGSAFKRNIARSTLKFTKAAGGGLTIRQDKSNFGPEQKPIHFAMRFETRTDDGRVCALRVRFERVDETAPEMIGADDHMPAEDKTLYALKRLYGRHERPVSVDEIAEERGVTSKTIYNNLGPLKQKGLVESGEDGYKPVSEADEYRL